jgi:Holliday junction resolvase RusA-like endonuclease
VVDQCESMPESSNPRSGELEDGAVIRFTVPGQPQGKGRPRIGRVGNHARMFTPAKTVAYEQSVSSAAHAALSGTPLISGPVSVTMLVECAVPMSWPKKKRNQAIAGQIAPTTKPDIDNVVKAVLDGCNGALWRDDVQVVDLRRVRKRYSLTPGVTVDVDVGPPLSAIAELQRVACDALAQERVEAFVIPLTGVIGRVLAAGSLEQLRALLAPGQPQPIARDLIDHQPEIQPCPTSDSCCMTTINAA